MPSPIGHSLFAYCVFPKGIAARFLIDSSGTLWRGIRILNALFLTAKVHLNCGQSITRDLGSKGGEDRGTFGELPRVSHPCSVARRFRVSSL